MPIALSWTKCFYKKSEESTHEPLLHEQGAPESAQSKDKEQNPLKRLGFGIDMYLKLQWQLILLFVLFSVLVIPLFVYYG
jgi:hypothetical protein